MDTENKLRQVRKKFRWKDELSSWAFVLPVVLGILIFTLMPMASSLYYSFTEYDTMVSASPQAFIGFENYRSIFTRLWSEVGSSLWTTVFYTLINVPLTLVLSFAMALLLNREMKGIKFLRTLLYAPVLIPTLVSGLLWLDLTGPNGAFNIVLEKLGLPSFTFFMSGNTAMFSFILMGMFTLGGNMILWIAQLKGIPEAVYEAAKIDGARYPTVLFRLVIPMCTPMIFYNLVLALINGLQTYASAIVVINHLNSSSLNFYVGYIYQTIINSNNLGLGCALSWILFLIIAVITGVTFRFNKWVYYEEGA